MGSPTHSVSPLLHLDKGLCCGRLVCKALDPESLESGKGERESLQWQRSRRVSLVTQPGYTDLWEANTVRSRQETIAAGGLRTSHFLGRSGEAG